MAGARRLDNEVRVGLEPQVKPAIQVVSQQPAVDPLDVVTFGKSARRHVREFGLLFGVILSGVSIYYWYRGGSASVINGCAVAGATFALLGLLAPRALLPIWRGWMRFAHYLSIVMTTVLLSLTWTLAFIPTALVLRLIGIKRIDRSYGDKRASYWDKRDPKYDDFKRLELQY